tara:strand:+ start:73 stop:1011 length:939 start_codon:yes stop_codon:yes gene_type:complete
MKSFSWVSFSVFIIVAAIAGIFASNFNFFPTNDEGTLRSYLIEATEDPSFVEGMSKTFQNIYKEKGIYPTEDQIRLTNECLKNEIFAQLIDSKETSIKTHLDKKHEIKSTSDWKQLFNSEIMGKYGDTLKGIVRSCQAENIEEEIKKNNNSPNKKIESENEKIEIEFPKGYIIYPDTKGLICSLSNEKGEYFYPSKENFFKRDFYLINLTFKGVAVVAASLPDKGWKYYQLLMDSVEELRWYSKYSTSRSSEYVLNRKDLKLRRYSCSSHDGSGFCRNRILEKKMICEVISGDELKKDWEITLKKAKEINQI